MTSDRSHERARADRRIAALAATGPLRAAVAHMAHGRLAEAERDSRRHLERNPDDVVALCVLGDIAARAGVYAEAERLFRRALELEPQLTDAQLNLAKILSQRDAVEEALDLLSTVSRDLPDRWDVELYRLTLLGQIGRYEESRHGFDALVARHRDVSAIWLAFGHLHNTQGDLAASIACYRRALSLDPNNTRAWWGLADLKIVPFGPGDVATMEDRLAALGELPGVTAPLHFAAGKACEDMGEIDAAFRHYDVGNRQMRGLTNFDVTETEREVADSCAFFAHERFAAHAGEGDPRSDPIFIVGMPRAGSTLLEQILASHSLVEGTSELPYIPMLVHRLLAERWSESGLTFPAVLRDLTPERTKALGQDYLAAAAVHRQMDRPFFIDKLPNNWAYIGFIHLILPNARIVDARRSPLACCWSCYRQWFARGQEFTYDLDDLGRYYRAYTHLIDHFEAVLPGHVIRVQHEILLARPDQTIRGMLAMLGLPFEQSCIDFHENDRAVRTASAQQVRRPIQQGSTDRWRAFEPYMSRLKQALGL